MIMRFSIQIIGGSIVLLYLSWKLTLVMLAPMPVIGCAAFFYGRWMRSVSRRVQDKLAQAIDSAEESVSGVRYVRAFGKEDREKQKYSDRIEESFTVGRLMAKVLAILQGNQLDHKVRINIYVVY
jgi:ABC-type multidrug transport system fused ATPase/permease subunit